MPGYHEPAPTARDALPTSAIPIPRSDAGVEELLVRLDDDRTEVGATDIDALEAEIDEVVYDLFDFTAEEREVVEAYLDVF